MLALELAAFWLSGTWVPGTIQQALYTYLTGYPSFGTIGLYAVRARQDSETPYAVYRFEQRVDIQVLDENSPGIVGQARVQISVFDEDYDLANGVAESIRIALSGFQGLMGGAAGVQVKHCLLIEMRDEDPAPETGLYEVFALYDLMFQITPSAPVPS